MNQLTHFNQSGETHMIDVGSKSVTQRTAIAEGFITMKPETLQLIMEGGHKKGDVLAVARIAGIMGSKKTAELIPLCHPLSITHVEINLIPSPENNRVQCRAVVKTNGQTGVEMEALNATQITLLTIYDMCKAVDRSMCIEGVRLLEKQGGKSGTWQYKPVTPCDLV